MDHEAGGLRPLHGGVRGDLLQPARRPGGAARERDQDRLQLDALQVRYSLSLSLKEKKTSLKALESNVRAVLCMQRCDQHLERRRLLHPPHHPQARRRRPQGVGLQRRHRREDPRDVHEAHPQQARAQDRPGVDAVVRPSAGNLN
jgi:hypothetical protein